MTRFDRLAALALVGVLGVAVVAGLLLGVDLDAGGKAPEPAASASAPCDQGAAEARLLAAKTSGLIRDYELQRGAGFVVVVQPGPWSRLGFADQDRLAAAADCAIAGEGKHLTGVVFRYERSGSDVAAFSATQLLRLREQGLSAG